MSKNEFPGLLTVAKSYNPSGEDLLMLGNTIITPARKNKTPSIVPIEMSPPRIPGSANQYVPRSSIDPSGSPFHAAMGLRSNPGFDGSPGSQGLLGMGSHNRISSSPQLNPLMLADRDYFPTQIVPMGLNMNPNPVFQPYLPQPGFARAPINRLDEDLPGMSPAVHNYLDKQNHLMAKILRDVEDFKKLEAMKQRDAMSQQLGLMNMPVASPVLPVLPVLPVEAMYSPFQQPYQLQQPMLPMQPMMNYGQLHSPMGQMRLRKQTPTILPPMNTTNPIYEEPQEERPPSIQQTLQLSAEPEEEKASPTKAPKKKPMKKANKTRGRRNLKAIAWTLALPGLWFISVVKWAEKRRTTVLKALEDSVPEHLEKFLEFSSEVLEKEIKALVTDKSLMILVQPPKTTIKPAEIDKRCKTITDHLVTILDSLSLKLDSGKLNKEFFQFIATLSENDAVLPDNFITGFEMDRLSFNMFGNLKYMSEWRSKMIIGSFVLIKGLLYFLLMRSWTVISTIPEKNVNMKNMINVGSALYHIVLDIFDEKVEHAGETETEPPFKAVPTTFSAVDPGVLNKLDVIPTDNENDTQEIISGFYDRDRLISYLDDRPSMMKEVREAVLDFLDVFYELTHSFYEPKAHVKKMFGVHRPK